MLVGTALAVADGGSVSGLVEEDVVAVMCNCVAARLSAIEHPFSGASLSFDPQITKRIGNNFGQLLTTRAVLMALGLGGDGGGSGWIKAGAVYTRRNGTWLPADEVLCGTEVDDWLELGVG